MDNNILEEHNFQILSDGTIYLRIASLGKESGSNIKFKGGSFGGVSLNSFRKAINSWNNYPSNVFPDPPSFDPFPDPPEPSEPTTEYININENGFDVYGYSMSIIGSGQLTFQPNQHDDKIYINIEKVDDYKIQIWITYPSGFNCSYLRLGGIPSSLKVEIQADDGSLSSFLRSEEDEELRYIDNSNYPNPNIIFITNDLNEDEALIDELIGNGIEIVIGEEV